MRQKSEEPLVRRSLNLEKGFTCKLKELRAMTEAASDSEVVREALRIYEQVIDDLEAGSRFFIERPDGVREELGLNAVDPAKEETGQDKTEGELVRRNLVLHTRSAHRLDALKQRTHAASDSELMREALRVYDKLVTDALDGSRFVVHYVNGTEERFRFTFANRPVARTEPAFKKFLSVVRRHALGAPRP